MWKKGQLILLYKQRGGDRVFLKVVLFAALGREGMGAPTLFYFKKRRKTHSFLAE